MSKSHTLKLISSSIRTCLLCLTLSFAHSGALAQQTVPDTIAQRAIACAACHGKEGRATNEGYFPRIAGKPAGYLYNQLVNFREGRRSYPAMTYMVAHLSDTYLKEMAEHFANLHPPYPPPQPANLPASTLERGKALVFSGDQSRNIPACIACHGEKLTGLLPSVPSLVGLPRDYLNAQFGAWKSGSRKAAAPDCMAQISKQLSVDEISAVSAWLAAQPVPENMAAAPAHSVKLPIPCGSVPQ
ncbi:cytochrome c553 [Paucimonas lemoignei]|uniref:Cytochrome c553 n=1 Tax=Paucimonas lemoignei TaxID=29443 RepID=A0A4R3HTT2_PAULE|nr:cytochrome c553 [Paucimonas lemoignei]